MMHRNEGRILERVPWRGNSTSLWLMLAISCLSGFMLHQVANYAFVAGTGTNGDTRDDVSSNQFGKRDSAKPGEFEQPNPRLSPSEVVSIQLSVLRQTKDDPKAIFGCYAFASPGNRNVVGSPEMLLDLIRRDYAPLIDCDSFQVGKAAILGDRSIVMVTTSDKNLDTYAFRFLLTKQASGPYRDCWMTDTVRLSAHASTTPTSPAVTPPSMKPANEGKNDKDAATR